MSTLIRRSKKGVKPAFTLNDEQRRRAKEHLLSVGIDLDQLPKLIWPDDAVAAYQSHEYAQWQFTLKSDILRDKRERMERNLLTKREYGRTEIRALYVWVFWCPGISGIFEGLWTYIVGNAREYHGGGYKGNLAGQMLAKVMDMFPVDNPRPLFQLEHREWMPLFVKKYQRGKWCGKPQGKAAVWARVYGGQLREIIEPVSWPSGGHQMTKPQLYRYPWGKNPKQQDMKDRLYRVLVWGKRKRCQRKDTLGHTTTWRGGNNCLIEFTDNGQREVISRNALRKA